MREPGIWKICRRIGMTELTASQQILADLQTDLGIIGPLDIVDAVAVITNRLIGFLFRMLFLEKRHRCAVKVGDISTKHLGGEAVLVHQFWFGVTFGGNFRRLQPKFGGSRIGDIMYAVAIDTGGNVRVAFSD